MSIIRILSNQEAKKIAAGEVVERPASVVKELIENSLDAKSSKISLYIEKAGKNLIRVVDNGHGMMPVDARLCFENHATSKITSLDDLQHIDSFGFRGEALASISSVSKVTLQTRFNNADHQEEVGVSLDCVDGKIEQEKNVGCAPGTDLRIKDLFYNTPVRRKFLKQDETEWNQIQNLFYAFCLSNLDVHFQLYRDNRMILNAPPIKSVKDRVMQIWGHNMMQSLVEFEQPESTTKKDFLVHGLISNHNFWRYGRQQMFFFVNGRWVKNTELSKAIMKGYRNVLPPARFPAVFLFITMDNTLVDINVHPRKEEVRFAKPVTVANNLQLLVTKTLEGLISKQFQGVADDVAVERILPEQASLQSRATIEAPHLSHELPAEPSPRSSRVAPLGDVSPFAKPPLPRMWGPRATADRSRDFNEKPSQQVTIEPQPSAKIIGQLLNTYIIVENDKGLLLIDQHAAHERILYEKYLKNFEQKDGTRLLFPEIVKLNDYQLSCVLREKDFLLKQGIEVEQIGSGELAIKTSPPKVQDKSLRELIFEMIEFIEHNEQLEDEEFRKKLNEHMHGQLACKMAVKAGDALSFDMMRNIVTQLQEVDNRFICVHGRPTTWAMSKIELEKTFRRRF